MGWWANRIIAFHGTLRRAAQRLVDRWRLKFAQAHGEGRYRTRPPREKKKKGRPNAMRHRHHASSFIVEIREMHSFISAQFSSLFLDLRSIDQPSSDALAPRPPPLVAGRLDVAVHKSAHGLWLCVHGHARMRQRQLRTRAGDRRREGGTQEVRAWHVHTHSLSPSLTHTLLLTWLGM